MNIEAKEFEIKMSYQELWTIAFDIKRALEYTIKTHWVNHQDAYGGGSNGRESERFKTLKTMFYSLGRPDIYEECEQMHKEIFEKHNACKK